MAVTRVERWANTAGPKRRQPARRSARVGWIARAAGESRSSLPRPLTGPSRRARRSGPREPPPRAAAASALALLQGGDLLPELHLRTDRKRERLTAADGDRAEGGSAGVGSEGGGARGEGKRVNHKSCRSIASPHEFGGLDPSSPPRFLPPSRADTCS